MSKPSDKRGGKSSNKRFSSKPQMSESKELTSKPMAGAFKGMKIGPECLECRGPIDSREAYSLPSPRGSKKSQRHGYLHTDCELEASKRFAQQFIGTNSMPRLELPVWSEEELVEFLKSKGVGS